MDDGVRFLQDLSVKGVIPKCSDLRVRKWLVVLPTYDAEQLRQVKEYKTLDFRVLGILSLNANSLESRFVDRKKNLISQCKNKVEK